MKEEIYTIPVMDGFKEDCECAFCAMRRTLEDNTINYVLSPSYMEEDVRGETNEKGFCREHLQRLYTEGNALGLALMLHSHMKAQHESMNRLLASASGSKKLFGRKQTEISPLEKHRVELQNSCYVCERVDQVFDRYIAAFFMLWKKNAEFRQTVKDSKGFCLNHFMQIYEAASRHLSADQTNEFRQIIGALQEENMKRMEDDLEWFTLKFDYRYKDKPWKNAKDALPRSILKINGQFADKSGKK